MKKINVIKRADVIKRIINMLLISSLVMCLLVACGRQSKYDEEYDYVLTYLHDTYGGDYTIKKCEFHQYDYGITGGQYMYDFEIRDSKGAKYNAHYMRLQDISEDTVSYLTFEPADSSRTNDSSRIDDSNIDDSYIADDMNVQYGVETEFVVLRVKDDYLNISTNRELVYVNVGVDYPELEDGQFASVKGTVDIYYGGEEGFLGNYFISEIEDVEILDFEEGIEIGGIADIREKTFANREFLLKYELPEEMFLLVCNRVMLEVYRNGEFVYEYSTAGLTVDEMTEPFYEHLDEISSIDYIEYGSTYNDNDKVMEKVSAAVTFFAVTDGIENIFVKEITLGSASGRVPGPTDYYYVGVAKISDDLAKSLMDKYDLEPVQIEYDRDIFMYVDGQGEQWLTSDALSDDFLKAGNEGKVYLCGNEIYFEILRY